MNNLPIEVKASLPVINTNFKAAKIRLEEMLKQYDLIIDEESVKTSKNMATEINKLKKEIADRRKAIIAELSAPLKEFEAQAKELEALCESTRQNLVTQAKVYDDKKRAEVQKLLKAELASLYSKYEVKPEFQTVKFEDLAIISHLNKSGLAKKAKDALDERVLEVKKLQEKIDTRLLTLGEICYKCGLNTPLTRENINHFLFESNDDIYLEKLTSLIKSEINRLKLADEQKRKQEEIKKEMEERVHLTKIVKPTVSTTPPQQTQTQIKNSKNEALFGVSRKQKFLVTATFEFEMDKKYEGEIRNLMLKKFEAAKFKTLPRVEVMAI